MKIHFNFFPKIPPVDPPQKPTSSTKTQRDSLSDRISTMWQTISESRVIPLSLRRLFVRLEVFQNETLKRIGYALQRVWPDVFTHSSPTPDLGKKDVLYVLKGLVDEQPEPVETVDTFEIGKQVAKDLDRTPWPLSYQKGDKTDTCAISQMKEQGVKKSEKILNWLKERLQSEPNMKDPQALSLAISNLASLLFHQSMCIDALKNLNKKLNSQHQEQDKIDLSMSKTPYSDACVCSNANGLTIALTWTFTVRSANAPEISFWDHNLTRTVSIPWDELTLDWHTNPPTSSKFTVIDHDSRCSTPPPLS